MKDKVEALLGKLKDNKDVEYLNVYEDKRDKVLNFYYNVTGKYKDNYFMIYMNKFAGHEVEYTITSQVTNNPKDFKTFLQTLSNLEFKIE
jgi:hypothetical protein